MSQNCGIRGEGTMQMRLTRRGLGLALATSGGARRCSGTASPLALVPASTAWAGSAPLISAGTLGTLGPAPRSTPTCCLRRDGGRDPGDRDSRARDRWLLMEMATTPALFDERYAAFLTVAGGTLVLHLRRSEPVPEEGHRFGPHRGGFHVPAADSRESCHASGAPAPRRPPAARGRSGRARPAGSAGR